VCHFMRGLSRAAILVTCLVVVTPSFAAKQEKWYEGRSQNFVVVCNAGEKQASKTAVQFEQIRAVFRKYLPIAGNHPSPVITIMAVKDEGSLRELIPEFWATKGHTHPAGIYFHGLGQAELAVQLDAQGPSPYATIYHEYYHSLSLPYFPNMPVWLAEGLADFFGHSEVNDQEARMGEPAPELIYEMQQSRLIPLNVLFKVDHTSPYYNESNKTSVFYAESWALTHYLMMADNQSHRSMLLAYLTALQQGASPEDASAKGFGDLNKLQNTLEQYVRRESYSYLKAATPPVNAEEIKVRELSEAEADAYLGGFQAIRGKFQEAKPLLEEAIRLDPNLAMAYQNQGLADFAGHDRDGALESFSKAVSLDPKNALTHYFRAYLSVGQGSVAEKDPQVESDLRQSIALDPNFAASYGLLATYLAAFNENLPEAFSFAKKAVELEPGNSSAMLSLAQVLVRMKRFDDAQTVAQSAESSATNPGDRARASQFLNYLQQAKSFSAQGGRNSGDVPPVPTNSSDHHVDTTEQRPVKPSTEQHAIGVVTKSSCVNGSPQIELQSSSGTIQLHVAPGTSMNITLSFDPPPGFNPCNSFKGYRASASYTPDDAQGTRGTLTALRILGPGDVGDAEDKSSEKAAGATNSGDDNGDSNTPGSPARAEGKVADVTCNGNEMLIKVSGGQRQFTLHARDFTRLTYYDDHSGPSSNGYAPCTELKGHTVSIIYVAGEQKKYDGEIQSVEIEQ